MNRTVESDQPNGSVAATTNSSTLKTAEAPEARVKACGEELAALLERHRCVLVRRQVLIDDRPAGPTEIILLAKD